MSGLDPADRRFRPASVACADALGRRRECAVVVRSGRAILAMPPGEAGLFTGPELSALIDALTAARNEIRRLES